MQTSFIVEPWRQGWRVRNTGYPSLQFEVDNNLDARILAAVLNTISEEQWLRIVKSELRAA